MEVSNSTNTLTCKDFTCCYVTREKKARVFLCGDYAFLCIAYGLSGASGKCLITYAYIVQTLYNAPY